MKCLSIFVYSWVDMYSFTPRIHHQTSDWCIWNTQYTTNYIGVRVGECNLSGRCKPPSDHSIKHMVWCNPPCIMVYNIHNENVWIESVPRICMYKVDILWTISTTLFLKKYLKRLQNILAIPSHHQLILCSI